jgi:hypothetical protein
MEKRAQPASPEEVGARQTRGTRKPVEANAKPRRPASATTRTTAANSRTAASRRATTSAPRKKVAATRAGKTTGSLAPGGSTVGPSSVEPTHDEIATRAYFIHLRRYGAEGDPDCDWMLALEELRRERGLD